MIHGEGENDFRCSWEKKEPGEGRGIYSPSRVGGEIFFLKRSVTLHCVGLFKANSGLNNESNLNFKIKRI